MPGLRWTIASVLIAALGACQAEDRSAEPVKPAGDTPATGGPLLRPYPYHVDFPYEVVPDHFKPGFPEGWTWGTIDGVYAESPDRVYMFQHGILPTLEQFVGPDGMPATRQGNRQEKLNRKEFILTIFDGNGNRIGYWEDLNSVYRPHGIKTNPSDPEKHVWLVNFAAESDSRFTPEAWSRMTTDVAIFKYTRDGKEVMRIGTDPKTGCPGAQDIWFLPDGDFWCLSEPPDGGVIKFSKDGKRLMEFGNKVGSGPGEFRAPHSIAIDRRGRILIGDRGNYRIQVFDQNGKYLESWPDVHARSMAIDKNDRLWVICGVDNCGKDKPPHSMAAYDVNSGNVLFTWGVAGGLPGQMYYNGQFDVDSQGDLYIVEVGGGRVQKFRPREGANPDHLIQWPLVR